MASLRSFVGQALDVCCSPSILLRDKGSRHSVHRPAQEKAAPVPESRASACSKPRRPNGPRSCAPPLPVPRRPAPTRRRWIPATWCPSPHQSGSRSATQMAGSRHCRNPAELWRERVARLPNGKRAASLRPSASPNLFGMKTPRWRSKFIASCGIEDSVEPRCFEAGNSDREKSANHW